MGGGVKSLKTYPGLLSEFLATESRRCTADQSTVYRKNNVGRREREREWGGGGVRQVAAGCVREVAAT